MGMGRKYVGQSSDEYFCACKGGAPVWVSSSKVVGEGVKRDV